MLLGHLAIYNTLSEENHLILKMPIAPEGEARSSPKCKIFLNHFPSSNCFPNSWASRKSTLIKIHFWLKLLERQDSHLLGKKKYPSRFVCVLRKKKNPIHSKQKGKPVLLFLAATLKAYSSRNQTQNNQYKKLLQSGKYCRLMVWWDIYSLVYYLLFKSKTDSKQEQFEKLANNYVQPLVTLVTLEDSVFGPGKISNILMSFLLSVKLPLSICRQQESYSMLCLIVQLS